MCPILTLIMGFNVGSRELAWHTIIVIFVHLKCPSVFLQGMPNNGNYFEANSTVKSILGK